MVVQLQTLLIKKMFDFVWPRLGKWMGIFDNHSQTIYKTSFGIDQRCKCISKQKWECAKRENPTLTP
jgi:hypothetical protein